MNFIKMLAAVAIALPSVSFADSLNVPFDRQAVISQNTTGIQVEFRFNNPDHQIILCRNYSSHEADLSINNVPNNRVNFPLNGELRLKVNKNLPGDILLNYPRGQFTIHSTDNHKLDMSCTFVDA